MADPVIKSKPYTVGGSLEMDSIDEMFRLLFDNLRDSIIGGTVNLTIPDAKEGDVVVIGADGGLDLVASAADGKLFRAAGTLNAPAWSTLTMPNTIASGAFFYASSANALAALTIGSAGKVVRSDGSIPAYSTFTIPDTFATGSFPYASSTNVLAALTIGSSGKMLRSTGTLPSWTSWTIDDAIAKGRILLTSALNTFGAGLAASRGDVLIGTSVPEWGALAVGAAGKVLRTDGTDIAYSTFTIPNTFTTGDLVYASATNTLAARAAVAAGSVLRAAGVATAPAYSTFTIPDTFATGTIPTATATNVLGVITPSTAGQVLTSNGAGVVASFQVGQSARPPMSRSRIRRRRKPTII